MAGIKTSSLFLCRASGGLMSIGPGIGVAMAGIQENVR
jgi:hypothetical protein